MRAKLKRDLKGMKIYQYIEERFLPSILILTTFLVIFWFVSYFRYGLDFTDESFYLVWISDPFRYVASVTSFGFLYHPIFKLVESDVALFRTIVFFISFSLAGFMFFIFVSLIGEKGLLKTGYKIVLSLGFAATVIMNYDLGILTPSYNTMNYQGLILTTIGFIVASINKHYSTTIGAVIIGLGGVVVFLAKPTSAILLAIVVMVFFIINSRMRSIKPLFIAACVSLVSLCITAIGIDGSVSVFWNRYSTGIELSQILNAGHNFKSTFRTVYLLISTLIMLTIIILVGKIFLVGWGEAFTLPIRDITLFLYLISIPYIYAFGSNHSFSILLPQVFSFWLLASMIFLRPLLVRHRVQIFASVLILSAQAICVVTAQNIIMQPYRQMAPLTGLTGEIIVGNAGDVIFVSEDVESYVDTARKTSLEVGFERETPVIDLTGHSPGILYLIGAEIIGQPWLVGGYRGSLNFTKLALQNVACSKLSSSWLLLEENGPRSINIDVLKSIGANFVADYKLVTKWQTARGVGGYYDRRIQALYKPINVSKVSNSCSALRKND